MIKYCIAFTLMLAFLFSYARHGETMPNFARKYGADCTLCHAQVPKLNRTGYEFRLAGYRFPTEIGKDENAFNLGDFFGARFQQQYKITESRPATGPRTSTNQLEFFEFTFYPLTGSWGKYFASIGEFSMAPDDVFEIENAFVRGVYGNDAAWFQARAGIMHPFEGFGASDRPISTLRPLFQRQRAVGSPFIIWNLDEEAAEAGYHFAASGTSISARISNGILWKGDGSGVAEPAQGGGLVKTEGGNTLATDRKNFQVFVNQFITPESAISLYYYRGVVPFVDPNEFTTPPPNTLDTFTRYVAYANFWAVPSLVNLLGGYEYGRDSLDDASINVTGTEGAARTFNGANVGKNWGYFGEVNVHPAAQLALAARYDYFDPSKKVKRNDMWAGTLSANYYWPNGLQFIADYQKKRTLASAGRNDDDLYQLRMIFIW
jgi:hypothetical protein